MSNTTSSLGAFLLGAAVGVTLGILYAPDKGSNTRRNILGKAEKLRDDAESKIEEGKDYVKSKYQEGKDTFSDLTSKGGDKTAGSKANSDDGKYKSKQGGYTPSM